MTIGPWGGITGMSVFKYEKDQQNNKPIGKLLLHDKVIIKIKKILKFLLGKQEKTSICMALCRYDKDIKQTIPTDKLVFGRDDNLLIYIDLYVENSKEVIRFYLNGPVLFLINDETPSDKEQSEIGCEHLYEILDSCLKNGNNMTRETEILNEMATKRAQKFGNGDFKKEDSAGAGEFDDDIPF